jgi:hypothetical protein
MFESLYYSVEFFWHLLAAALCPFPSGLNFVKTFCHVVRFWKPIKIE